MNARDRYALNVYATAVALATAASGCMMASEDRAARSTAVESDKQAFGEVARPPASPQRSARARAAGKALMPAPGQQMARMELAAADEAAEYEADIDGLSADAPAEPAAPTRSWFPETFLFAPAVPTNAEGRAERALTVPDRLTTWRILALAHDRQGGRGGAVGRFDSVLPVYVDPVLPDALVAGDRIDVPILVVNTTEEARQTTLTVEAAGAAQVKESLRVRLEGQSSVVRYVSVRVQQPGTLTLTFAVRGADRVVRRVPVRAPGKPERQERNGALADAVAFRLKLPPNTRPDSVQADLTVYPGALALVRDELLTAGRRQSLADAAYALRLAGTAKPLVARLGGQVDPKQLRQLRLRAAQRILRASRSPRIEQALLLALAAGPHGRDPLLGRLGDRLARQIAGAQRPDGTFTGGNGWSLQRVVVATAAGLESLAAVADDEASQRLLRGATIRAEGAFERYADAVRDSYTAAAVLASGHVRGTLADKLRARVRDGVRSTTSGGRRLVPPTGVQAASGETPSVIEATALAVLALKDDPQAADILPGLGNTLLTGYRAGRGWGSGRANLTALAAAVALFDEPLPPRVQVRLFNGDAVVAQTVLEGPDRTARQGIRVAVPGAVRAPKWRVEASPPVPGLAFALTVDYRVPWAPAPEAGLTLEVEASGRATVGVPTDVLLSASAPGGRALTVRYAMPAGFAAMPADLAKLQATGTVQGYRVNASGVELDLPTRAPGSAAQVSFRIVPSFAGRLQAEASWVALSRGRSSVDIAPMTWTVARAQTSR